jgi:hypothetical protein
MNRTVREIMDRVSRCENPLTLDAGSQRAFSDRQAKLVDNEKWPLQRWYTDLDFCRAYNTAVEQSREVARLLKANKLLTYMVENGLGPDDMRTD